MVAQGIVGRKANGSLPRPGTLRAEMIRRGWVEADPKPPVPFLIIPEALPAPAPGGPTRPGPQPWNIGITPGYRRPRPGDTEPTTRGDLRRAVRRAVRRVRRGVAGAVRAVAAPNRGGGRSC